MSTLTDRTLRIRFGETLDLATGPLAPRVLAHSAEEADLALVATGALLLGGDEVRVDLEVGPGKHLALRDTAATVAHHGRGRPAALHTHIRVAAGAALIWDAQPLVVADGAHVERTLTVEVAEGGVVLLRDPLVLGRSGEQGGSLRCRTSVTYDARPALVETLSLDEQRGEVAVLGQQRVVDSLLALGWRPQESLDEPTVYDLAEPGRLLRWLGPAAHASPVGAAWQSWRAEAGRAVR